MLDGESLLVSFDENGTLVKSVYMPINTESDDNNNNINNITYNISDYSVVSDNGDDSGVAHRRGISAWSHMLRMWSSRNQFACSKNTLRH